MNVKIDRSFERDTNKIKDNKLLDKIAACITDAMTSQSIDDIKGIKKLKGAPFHYRIRIGDYRAGVVIQGSDIIFERFLHRKDIYKYFPKT
ncbi:MAG: plasmid stabilization protein [Bacteroidetes bacterium RIFOXYB2_FULL_35_7]|nr:MAG: plasmid stabilization protein [Bacteroidetes bacterium GWF2_35_48]OFY92238.1 MAG: plasmid stabilization protein [Bacteroidetes bacterium RIFOXYB2_FULL_35_7]HBX50968.1 plasmid stabilization protein [Bacteroidales bacterium]